jgi:endonuclease/exonuclease/phosphatase family metal-dependent hydrolase
MPSLKIATWNVENLFVPPPEAPQADRAAYDAKLGFLAQTITALDPDVIALQEVGGDAALQSLQAVLPTYAHRRAGVADGRGIACAFLSKLPLQNAQDIVNFPAEVLALGATDANGVRLQRMGRGALRVRITKAGFTTDLISIHLKSKLLTFPLPGGGTAFSTNDEGVRAQAAAVALMRRTAEAATVRIAANAIIADNNVNALAILGDLNDGPSAATTQVFQGPDGSELDTRGFDMPDQGDNARLWNLAPLITEDRRFSRIHRGQGQLLDQVFVSEEFFPREDTGDRRIPTQVDSIVEHIRSIGDNPGARVGEVRPDHAPVVATFEIG